MQRQHRPLPGEPLKGGVAHGEIGPTDGPTPAAASLCIGVHFQFEVVYWGDRRNGDGGQ